MISPYDLVKEIEEETSAPLVKLEKLVDRIIKENFSDRSFRHFEKGTSFKVNDIPKFKLRQLEERYQASGFKRIDICICDNGTVYVACYPLPYSSYIK